MTSRPLRFLLLTIGLWVCMRAAVLAPGWWRGQDAPNPTRPATALARPPIPVRGPTAAAVEAAPSLIERMAGAGGLVAAGPYPMTQVPREVAANPSPAPARRPAAFPGLVPAPAGALAMPGLARRPGAPVLGVATSSQSGSGFASLAPQAAASSRWSVSAWLLVRRERGGSALAPGGTLGGSQAGARIAYPLGGGLALSARAYLPLRRPAGAEAAAGLDWQFVAALPIQLRAERRQALGSEGRSAFALSLYGGAGRALSRRLRVDAYGQAGVVGVRARDLFVDGAVRVSAALGPVEVGAGAWGAAQPGAARLDAGPALTYRLPVGGANVRLEAGWRFRIAGDAAPRSGPALTLGTDF